MGMYDACRLMCLNLYSFVENPFSKDAKLDERKLYEVAYIQQQLADDLIDLEIEHIDRIIAKINSEDNPKLYATELNLWTNIRAITKGGRRTGCGFTALGDMLAALGLKYDSKKASEVIETVMRIKMKAELNCTIQMSKDRGAFEQWDNTKEFTIRKLDSGQVDYIKGSNDFYQFITEEYLGEAMDMYKNGRRNVSWSTVAPTGSVSILTQTTSGLEPLFAPYYMRRKKVNPGENVRIDFVDPNGDSWMEYPILHPKFKDWMEWDTLTIFEEDGYPTQDEVEKAFKRSPWYGSTANDIDWTKRVEIQGLIQRYTTHSISSTINLPENTPKEMIHTIYIESWKKGLKGVTVYRDGCRTGVLVNTNEKKNESFSYKDAMKRPEALNCDIYRTKAKGDPFTIIVGLIDSKPYEVFGIPTLLMEGFDSGILTKKARGVYNLTCSLDKELSIIKDITKGMTDEQEVITRLISTSLRHGADIRFIVEQISKTDGELHSFTKAIARILKHYIPDGSISTLSCQECGSKSIVFEEGCSKCKECGSSKCG